ncbi:MAG: glycogen debranching enzyme GlgX [Pseudomonadota bacterium]
MAEKDRTGVNFAVYSRLATRVEVCLFDASGSHETARLVLPARTANIWHGFVPGLRAGQVYGLRAHGPFAPSAGHRFNPSKLLLDPYARAVAGGAHSLKSQVLDLDTELTAGAAIAPCPTVPLAQVVLYEVHVKGLTQRHPQVPAALRGTYAGLASAPLLAHYRQLGVSTLCLLPVQLFVTEAHLLKKKLHNYRGYNTLAYFVPHAAYASGQHCDERAEFRHMVDQLHHAGLEVVMDVVLNHSAEGDANGLTLSWRGLDNASWYTLDAQGQHLNFSGCGNSFNLNEACAVQMVMDSLRWWVQAYGVDGFRFDLATALGRDPLLNHHFHPLSALLMAIGQDPVLAPVRCIAEPWDLGPGGYQLGHFPPGWLEWNDRFRDTCRAFWLGHNCTRGELARRITGSSDYFHHDGRSPLASVNLITAHDGMTLHDLTTYSHKHNEPNQEENRNGHHTDFSANAGVEGPCRDAAVQAVRGQWRRALLATLFLAQGVPQLLAGDELGHTQGGNNNAYCQDNKTSWLDWQHADHALTDYVAAIVHLRTSQPALRCGQWFKGNGDLSWFKPDASPLSATDWDDPTQRSMAIVIDTKHTADVPSRTRWLLIFHAGSADQSFALPAGPWCHVLNSAASMVLPASQWDLVAPCAGEITLPPRSVFALVQT